MPKTEPIVVIGTGRFVWYEELQVIDFIPKGKKTHTYTIHLHRKNNNAMDALRAIIYYLSDPTNETS